MSRRHSSEFDALGHRDRSQGRSSLPLHLALLALTAAIGLGLTGAPSDAATERPTAPTLSPQRFAEVSSGVVLVHTLTCGGRLTGSGTGFLIGDRIVMTARHVVDPPGERPACRTRVRVKGQWVAVDAWSWWYHRRPADGRTVDMAVLKLARRVDTHLFAIRARPVPIGTNVAAIGHPLGNQLAVTQGRVVARKRYEGVPMVFVRLLGAEGSSGSPLVDDDGKVVGILQLGLSDGKDVLGQHTSGVIAGLDLNSWWGSGKRDLCKAYPNGGIPMCGGTVTTPPTPKPPPTPTCDDKAFLADVGPDWKAATDSWTQWNAILDGRAAGDWIAALETAFVALEQAASSTSLYAPADVCSSGLRQAITLIAGVPALTTDARTRFNAFLGTVANTPEGDAALKAASAALVALDARIKAIDAAFAAR